MSGFAPLESIYTHVNVCRNALQHDIIYQNFKNNADYTRVLEHCPTDVAQRALRSILNREKTIDWGQIRINDAIGNPVTTNFEPIFKEYNIVLDHYTFSNTTILYTFQALDIISRMDTPMRVVEIGGGYGGLCKVLHILASHLILSYTIIDIEDVSKHQHKYLTDMDLPDVKCIPYLEYTARSFDLCVSIYALGEFTRPVIDFYYVNVIQHSTSKYLWWNISHVPSYIVNYNAEPTGLSIDGMDIVLTDNFTRYS